jgi:hypothetical protein
MTRLLPSCLLSVPALLLVSCLSASAAAVTATDRGGSMTTGGTAQNAMSSNASRAGCWVQNPVNATEDLYVSSTTSATTTAGAGDDADLAPGGSWSCVQGSNVIQSAISVNAATSGHAYIAKETQ